MDQQAEQDEYAGRPVEELVLEEKKTKQTRLIFLVLSVGATLATLYAIAMHRPTGFGHVAAILLSLFLLLRSGSKLARIQAELANRNPPPPLA